LNVFDEGYFIDSNKRKIDFRNSLIILTSNLGFTNDNINKKTLGFLSEDANKIEIEKAVNKHFKPEFINRLDDIIYFKSLSYESSIELANNYFNEYKKGLNYEISNDKLDELIKSIDVNKYGARGIKREVKKYISNQVKESNLTRT
jgi:ATP-dependent Clp protease ATP-binding subunit ClpA